MGFSPAFDNALIVATLAHRRQLRKGTQVPYVMHPVHVSTLLSRFRYGEPLSVAGLLHDVLEDAPFDERAFQEDLRSAFPDYAWTEVADAVTFREEVEKFLAATFGADVLRLVRAVTDAKHDGGPERPWIDRRRQQLEHLAHAADDEATLKAADALHNVWSIVQDVRLGRASIEGRFKATPEQSLWYYEEVARVTRSRIGGGPLSDALDAAVGELRELIARR